MAAFLTPGTIFYTILALGAKLGAAAAFNVTFMYTAQLYPTSIRNSAVGTCSTIARVGGMMAPIIGKFLIELGKVIVSRECIVEFYSELIFWPDSGGSSSLSLRRVRSYWWSVRSPPTRSRGFPPPQHIRGYRGDKEEIQTCLEMLLGPG